MASLSGLKHKVRVQHPAYTFSDFFQALQNLHENLVETQENAPSGLDGIVAASAVPVTEKTQTRLLYKATNTGNSCSIVKNVNTASKHTEKGPSDNINQPPLNTNAKIGVVTQSISQTDTQQLATLGDGGLQFQPTPESGQAFDSVLPDPNCGMYVREEKIPLYVWNQKDYCKDYKACLSQSDDIFGYVPLTDLKTYTGPSVKWDTVSDIIEAHKLVRQSGVPNFLKCRIPVETNLNANVWRTHLRNYWDQQLPDLLQFGFPLDFHRDSVLSSSSTNHTSASQFQADVDAYINEELTHGAIYGPFDNPPFPVHISPLMTREKQNSAVRRIIVDLSWPKGALVNDFVHKCKYLDTYFTKS